MQNYSQTINHRHVDFIELVQPRFLRILPQDLTLTNRRSVRFVYFSHVSSNKPKLAEKLDQIQSISINIGEFSFRSRFLLLSGTLVLEQINDSHWSRKQSAFTSEPPLPKCMKSGNAIISVRQINALNKINNSHNLLHNCLNTRAKWQNFHSSPCLREAEYFLRLYRPFDVTTVTGSLLPLGNQRVQIRQRAIFTIKFHG